MRWLPTRLNTFGATRLADPAMASHPEFHEGKVVFLEMQRVVSPGELNRHPKVPAVSAGRGFVREAAVK
jgi:hypothetical protein